MPRIQIALIVAAVISVALPIAGCNVGASPSGDEHVATTGAAPTVAVDATSGVELVAYFGAAGEGHDAGGSGTNGTNGKGGTNVYLIRRKAGGTWSAPVRVNARKSDASPHGQAPAQVRIGADGTVYVAWTNAIPVEGRRFAASNLYVARSDDGGVTFAQEVPVNSDHGGYPAGHTFHDLAVAPDGTVFVSWLDSRERYLAEKNAGEGVDPESFPGTQIWVARSTDRGASFGEGVVVARGTCECCRTSLALASDGKIYVAWRHQFPGQERDMAIANSTDGGLTFSEPKRIHDDAWQFEGCPHSGPSLQVDRTGRVHVGWFTGKPEAPGLYYTSAADGRSFAEAQALQLGVGVSQIKLAAETQAGIPITWEGPNGTLGFAYADNEGALTFLPETTTGRLPAIASGNNATVTVAERDRNAVVVRSWR